MKVTKPQKACNVEFELIKFPCIAMPKVDGVRGLKIGQYFTGRTLKMFRNNHLTDQLSDPLLTGLDGELAYGSLTSPTLCRDTTSYCNSYSYNTSNVLPNWMIFDLISEETAGLPYMKRLELAISYVKHLKEKDEKFWYLQTVPEHRLCHSLEEVEAAHSEFISLGYEGTIGRSLYQPHKNGRATMRENAYWRIKDFATEEGIIIGFEEAEINLNPALINELGYIERSSAKAGKVPGGMLGNIKIRRLADGQEYTIGPGKLTHKERTEYFNEPQRFLNKLCTFTHFPYGAKDKLRFGLFSSFRLPEDL